MKLEDHVNEMLKKLENPQLKSRDDVEQFYRDWMEVVWDLKVPSKLFDFYKPDIYVYRENNNSSNGVREIIKEVLAVEAAFPDIKVRIEGVVVTGDEEHGYQLFARRYFNGTNSGYSQYGEPTGKELEGDTCLSLDMLKLEKVDGRWQVVNEYTMYSERTMRVTMGGPKEV